MQLAKLTCDLDRLTVADAIIIERHLNTLIWRAGLILFGAFIATAGLTLLLMCLYSVLARSYGGVPVAIVLGATLCAVGVMVVIIAQRAKPGREIALAQTIRADALKAIESDLLTHEHLQLHPATAALISSIALQVVGGLARSLRPFGQDNSSSKDNASRL